MRDKPDVAALASLDDQRVTILAWHYHDDDVPGPAADVTLTIAGLPLKQGRARLQHFRIDESTATPSPPGSGWARRKRRRRSSTRNWRRPGSSTAMPGPATIDVADARATLRFALPRQAVSLLVVEW